MIVSWRLILLYPEFNEESKFDSGFAQKRDFYDFPIFKMRIEWWVWLMSFFVFLFINSFRNEFQKVETRHQPKIPNTMNFTWTNILPYPEFNEESEFYSGFAPKRDFDDFPDLPKNASQLRRLYLLFNNVKRPTLSQKIRPEPNISVSTMSF